MDDNRQSANDNPPKPVTNRRAPRKASARTRPVAAGSGAATTAPRRAVPAEAAAQPDRSGRLPAPEIRRGDRPMAPIHFAADVTRIAATAHLTGGLSPAALAMAGFDWWLHLAGSPGKRMQLAENAARKASRLALHIATAGQQPDAPPCIETPPGDRRFSGDAWRKPPFSIMAQTFLLQQQWWYNATNGVPGMSPHHQDVVSFMARQILDVFSPSNNPLTNPEIIARTIETGGQNIVQGYLNWREDLSRESNGQPPVGAENFRVGHEVALTPGKVVYRNHLIELIQYSPTTPNVRAEPVLIVPAWIMKYYILDLSPENSLVRYLVDQGFTVFCISWRNPDAGDRDLSMEDYRAMGVMAALDAVNAIVPGQKVHATGYCIGGTLLTIAAAGMSCGSDDRLASMTLFAAQTDFTEPGELALFIDHSQLNFLDGVMWSRGYLSADQMAGAFQMLRSNDLVWSRLVRDYLMGERVPMFDLMAWNADSTRMPYRMHTEYLQRLYLDNELATGRFMVEGRPAAIQNIRVPMFAVGTERDHVAPWKSVYKVHYLTDTDVTFVLTSGGHNAGIVSEPGRPRRRYRIAHHREGDCVIGPEEWAATFQPKPGSWWVDWVAWLDHHSAPEQVSPPAMGAKGLPPLMDAPGSYVLQR